MSHSLTGIWRTILAGRDKAWVLFAHGTCVLIPDAGEDTARHAVELLQKNGVQAGTDSGDFNVFPAEGAPGWIVTCFHPDILSYVGPDEVPPGTNEIVIGLTGRQKRARDAQELQAVHVERLE